MYNKDCKVISTTAHQVILFINEFRITNASFIYLHNLTILIVFEEVSKS
jgi:hypothetical protein